MERLLLFCLITLAGNAIGVPDYTVVAPKAFRVGVEETVVLNLHEYQGATVSYYLQDIPNRISIFSENEKVVTALQSKDPILLKFTVGSEDIEVFRNRQKVLMVIEVTNSVKDFTSQSDVLVSKESGYLFVRTDRPIYRPNEFVRIQVAPLNQKMAPTDTEIVTVTVKTPDGIGVYRRRLRLPPDQFIELEYEIQSFPEIGIWFVEAEYSANGFETTTDTSFRIDRYVLPTFDVKVELNKNYFLPNDVAIDGHILATYSYGLKVSGNFFVTLKLFKHPDAAPIEFFKLPGTFESVAVILNGRARFTVPVGDILDVLEDGETIATLTANKATFVVEATVNGRAEGVLESAISPRIPFIESPYTIDISRTSLYYTPGIAYHLRVDILDSIRRKPVPDVSATITAGGEESSTHSDSGGLVDFQVDFVGNGPQLVVIVTADPDLEGVGQQAQVQLNLLPYDSPSSNYLQLTTSHPNARVGQPNFFVTFTVSYNAVEEIRYYVVSRGSIVASGVDKPNQGSTQSSLLLSITQNMVPEARVVAYYLVGTEVVSNSLWFDVVDRCKDELIVTVDEEVRPGDAVEFNVQGSSNALVGLSGVDRAAYFLYDESRLTRTKMFDEMESYDQGCIRNGGANNRNVFLNAGLVMQSPAISPSRVDTLECPGQGQQGQSRKKRQADGGDNAREQYIAERLAACTRDGQLAGINGENCRSRGARVFDNQQDILGCFAAFRTACRDATREKSRRGYKPQGRTLAVQSQVDLSIARQRTDFQESLIFSTIKLDENGRRTITRKARDSITTFEIDAMSMQDEADGFCVADTSELLVFKNVFVQLYIPYSLKLGEQASIRLSVFNHASDTDYTVNIEVKPHSAFCTHYTADEWTLRRKNVDLPRNSAASDSFAVLPLSIPPGGLASLEVRVLAGNRAILDSIKKEVLIEPEGEVKDTFQSYPISAPFPSAFDVKFDFPEQFVPGSRSCTIYAYTNFLGPAIEVNPNNGVPNNVADIFRQPYGCGEQNMLACGPNIYTHAYLEAVGRLTPNTQPNYDQSIRRMEEGYDRELMFRSKLADPPLSAFAVWNNHVPSTWLNAFVDKVFSKAKLYYKDLDTGPICSSLNFLIGEQQNAGYYREKRPPYHREMVGAVGGRLTLTAYVLIALEESGSVCPDMMDRLTESKNKAVKFFGENKDDVTLRTRPYAIALLTYALALHGTELALTSDFFVRLLSYQSVTEDNRMVFWQGRPLSDIQGTELHDYWYRKRPQAIDVETTAYALLAHIEFAKHTDLNQRDLDRMRKIALWLVSQRNEGGAFMSTQDTVIGLQALAAYETWVHSLNPEQPLNDITISLTTPQNATTWGPLSPHSFEMDENNNEFKETINVPSDVVDVGSVTVGAFGTGEGILSYRCLYRTVVEEGSCHFEINYDVEYNNLDLHMRREEVLLEMKLTVTVAKRVGSNALMSIVEVGLLSGFVSVLDTVRRLSIQEFADGIAERFEVTNQNVILYLRKIDTEEISLTFNMVQNIKVARPQPVQIRVYDYYEPGVSCAIFYSLPDNTPDIRTTNCEGSTDDSLCRCAEGGCMTCRSRRQQLEETACIDGRSNCEICKGTKCENLFEKACNSNYAYVVTVTAILPHSNSDVFITFKGTIHRILKYGDDNTAQVGIEQTFMARRDCYTNCVDPEFYESQTSRNQNGDYIRTGYALTVMGAKPDTGLDRNNMPFHHYILDKKAILERYIPNCDGVISDYDRLDCGDKTIRRSSRDRRTCKRASRFIHPCRNFNMLIEQLNEGCD